MKTTINNNKTATSILVAFFTFAVAMSNAQQITINQRSQLVMNGNVHLVVNNAAFSNNGTFSASSSTVKFSGYGDTTKTFVSGTNATTFNNLTISKSASGVKLKATSNVKNTLTVNGGILFTDSNLVLKSDAALTARVAAISTGCNIIGKSRVERFIPVKRAWRLMTAPVTDANTIYQTWQNNGVYAAGTGTFITGPSATANGTNGLDVSPQMNTSLKTWNTATQSLAAVTNTNVSLAGTNNGSADNNAYFMFIRGDRNPSNLSTVVCNTTTLTANGRLQVGNQQFNVSAAAGAYTLIGNPYASPVDFNNVTKSNVMNRFYAWDPTLNNLGGYVMLDDLLNTGSFIKSVLASVMTKDIQSGQAIFVQTLLPAAAAVTFTESSKSSATTNQVFRPSTTTLPSQFLRANLYAVNADNSLLLADGIFAEFNETFSDSVLNEDALKFTNIGENIAFQRYGTSLAAERRPFIVAKDTLYIRIWKTTQRTYQFEFIPTGLNATDIILQDKYLNTNTALSASVATSIRFTIDANSASAAQDRFRIVFKKVMVLPVTITNVAAYQQNNNIAVEWKVENEINMVKYDVEKSTNGTSFTKATTINANGNNNANSYNWMDVNASTGANFFRIKTYDNNGEVKYSAIVKVVMNKTATSSMSIYPNPVVNNTINLQLSNQPKGTYQMKLTNMSGQTIQTASMNSNNSNTTLSINVATHMAAGSYNLQVVAPNGTTTTQQVIVQ